MKEEENNLSSNNCPETKISQGLNLDTIKVVRLVKLDSSTNSLLA